MEFQSLLLNIQVKVLVFWDYDWTFPTAVIIGHEVEGIGNDVCRAVNASVELPMYGNKQSLNVSVAYGILIYELLRKYVQNLPLLTFIYLKN